MKLASILFVVLLGGSAASADDRIPLNPYAQPVPAARAHGKKQQLRKLLMRHFDQDHDGQLEPRERRRATRALRKLAHQMQRMDARQMRRKRFIRRFDLDRDGHIGPGELPPALSDQLRPLDRDGDGWLQGNELP